MKRTSKARMTVLWSLTPMVSREWLETPTKKKKVMTHKKELASQNARVTQNLEETSNVELFEIDIIEELNLEYDECEESTELSKLLLKF